MSLREKLEAIRRMKETEAFELQAPDRALETFKAEVKEIEPIEDKPLSAKLKEASLQSLNLGMKPGHAEISRICSIPIEYELTPEEVEAFCRTRLLAEAYDQGFRLHPIQVRAVMAYEACGGLFAPIGVGWGKTLITLMIVQSAFTRRDIKKSILLVPPQVYQQLTRADIPWARRRIPLSVPFIFLGGLSRTSRLAAAKSKRSGCYIMPYSCLSTKDTSEVLFDISPGLIICDEAHLVKHRHAARTRRLLEVITAVHPQFCALSGTITNKSVMDYHHLIRAGLGLQSPVPLSPVMAGEWGAVIDAMAGESDAGSTGPLLPLVTWAQLNFPSDKVRETREGLRRAYRLRLVTAPGVAATGDNEIGTSLELCDRPAFEHTERAKEAQKLAEFEGGAQLASLMKQVEDLWLTPNGDEIDYAIHSFKWLYELSAGFYNELVWPTDEAYAQRKNISVDTAAGILERARAHHAKAQVYLKALRTWLKEHARVGLDTPMLVGADMARNKEMNVGHDLYLAWAEMKAAEFDGMPERDSRAVRVCPYKINAAVKWASERRAESDAGIILWTYHQEVLAWLYESLQAAGLDAVACPAGPQFDRLIGDPATAKKIVVASISAHGTGKNLQAFQHTRFVQWPRGANVAEQTLGRNHRIGQQADHLEMCLDLPLLFDRIVFCATVNDALYIQQTTSVRQKVIYASYDPLPAMFSHAVMKERGMEPERLSRESMQLLEEKFGGSIESS